MRRKWFDSIYGQLYHPRAMGQRPARFIFSLLLLFIPIGCDRNSAPAVTPTTRPITVASLSPAATEILIGLGARDRLVAVSNFEPPRESVAGLPRVGDYQSTDWERLAALRPSVMVTQFAADRLPAGLVQRAEAINIKLVNVPITRLDDIYAAITVLGEAIGDEARGGQLRASVEQRLNVIRGKYTGRRIRALIVVDESARSVVGHDNYLHDILLVAGGQNVILPGSPPYPSIDREILLDLDPEVIFQLLPSASPQVQGQARQLWESLPQLQAVKNGRVHVFTDPFVLQPSQHVGELAQRFAAALADARNAGTQPVAMP